MQPCHRARSGGGRKGEGRGDAGRRLRGEGVCKGKEEGGTRDAAGHGLKPLTMGGGRVVRYATPREACLVFGQAEVLV